MGTMMMAGAMKFGRLALLWLLKEFAEEVVLAGALLMLPL